MTSDVLQVIRVFWNIALTFMTAFEIPGTHMTPLGMLLFAGLFYFAVRLVRYWFFGVNDHD